MTKSHENVNKNNSFNSNTTNKIYTPNTTQVPNIVIDYWMRVLEKSHFLVLLAIVRKTLGWHKEKDMISRRQLSEITGLSLRSVDAAVKKLQSLKLIDATHTTTTLGDPETTTYQLFLHDGEWCNGCGGGSAMVAGGGSAMVAGHTKESNTKIKEPPISPKGGVSIEKIPMVTYGKHVKMKQAYYDARVAELGKALVDDIIEDIEIYCESHGWTYTSYAGAFRRFLKGRKLRQNDKGGVVVASKEENRSWASQLSFRANNYECHAGPEGLEIYRVSGNEPYNKLIPYRERGFREQCESELRKVGLWRGDAEQTKPRDS